MNILKFKEGNILLIDKNKITAIYNQSLLIKSFYDPEISYEKDKDIYKERSPHERG